MALRRSLYPWALGWGSPWLTHQRGLAINWEISKTRKWWAKQKTNELTDEREKNPKLCTQRRAWMERQRKCLCHWGLRSCHPRQPAPLLLGETNSVFKSEMGGNRRFEALRAIPAAAPSFSRGSRKKDTICGPALPSNGKAELGALAGAQQWAGKVKNKEEMASRDSPVLYMQILRGLTDEDQSREKQSSHNLLVEADSFFSRILSILY